jgi:hypothetical protein
LNSCVWRRARLIERVTAFDAFLGEMVSLAREFD